jgi:NADH:ubiquinone oxidoreductase subunit F (NADH-binding)
MEPPRAAAPRDLPRLLGPGGADLAGHLRTHGPLPLANTSALIAEIEAAGLTGRGGAGFPTEVKLAAVARQRGGKVVAGNGAEGEPASHKDKQLLWLAPHLVLDGLQLAAAAVGARRACLYVHRNDQLQHRLTGALAERAAAGWDRIAVELVTAPPRFLSGEESALASRIGGGLARPRFKRPPVYERGAGGAPTLVQNVETLAHLALIARHGAAWFRQAGTAAEPGSMIVTAHRADGTVVVREVPIGVPVGDVLGRSAAQAVLVGGYHGAWLPAEEAMGLPLANAALRPLGAAVGAGVLAALPPDRCGLAETAWVLRYLAAESAGQCGPCLNGLPRIAATFTALARLLADRRCLDDLERWAGLVTGRGACHHPDGTVRLVRSALATFSAETARHLRGQCTAVQALPSPVQALPSPVQALPSPTPAARPFLPVPGDGRAAPAARHDWR